MSSTTESQRAPSLDDILARLAELAPPPEQSSPSAPVPEGPRARNAPLLDLDRIAEATEALVPAGTTSTEESITEQSDAAPSVIDLRDRVERESQVSSTVGDVTAPPAKPEIRESDTHELEIEPEIDEPEVERERAIETVVAEAIVESVVAERDAEAAVTEAQPQPPAPPAEIDLRPIEPVDISRDEPISAPADAARRSGQPRPAARRHNPFKRLIIWSLMLGLGLLVGALILLVT